LDAALHSLERGVSFGQWWSARAAAFKRLREDEFIPPELIDLVEGSRGMTPVRTHYYKGDDGGLRFSIKRCRKKTRGSVTASEALAFFLRIMLRELKHGEKQRRAPTRASKLVPRSVIGEIALDMLGDCELWNAPPGPLLIQLIRELLDLEHRRVATRRLVQEDRVAFIVAQDPSITTRELARMLKINAGTISRLRRTPEFKKKVDGTAQVIAALKADGSWAKMTSDAKKKRLKHLRRKPSSSRMHRDH
jgi:hypothetical protein